MLSRNPLDRLANFALHAVLDRHPDIFDRLGSFAKCRYLIDMTDSPCSLLLLLQEKRVCVCWRSPSVRADVTIRGSFTTLVHLAQGTGDGDALFFSRDITIEGDTEAVLALRNALDDAGIDILHDGLEALGFWGFPLKFGYKAMKEMRPIISGMFAP